MSNPSEDRAAARPGGARPPGALGIVRCSGPNAVGPSAPGGRAPPFDPEALRAALLRYAARLLGDLDRAKDVVQDVMMRFAAQRRRGADLSGREAEWMFTVCRRRVIDLIRKDERLSVVAGEHLDEIGAPLRHPASMMEAEETQEALRASIALLPANQQEAIRLKFQNGFSYKEIARITELSVGNVGFLIHTAVARLRREFHKQEKS